VVTNAQSTPSESGAAHVSELHGSRIVIRPGLLDACADELRAVGGLDRRRIAIISDDVVAPLYAARVATACVGLQGPASATFTVQAGEASKTRAQWARLTDEMLDAGYGRDSVVVAIGGGVVGDLAGFVAATFMRGIPLVHVPTTLLAMIDASIGGKTGVDTHTGKNLVGAFHHPALVAVDPTALRTLPVAHLRNGLAEAIKHSVIASPADFAWIASNVGAIVRDGGPEDDIAERLVRRNIEIKANIVSRDEREHGVRKTLNFGHTIGHAIETESGFTLLHGECVAIGMVAEARIAANLGIGDAGLPDLIARVLRDVGLPVALPAGVSPHAVLIATRADKKARAGVVEYALPERLGTMAGADRGYAIAVPDAVVLKSLSR
jgi:3-dehydroquinate synthase